MALIETPKPALERSPAGRDSAPEQLRKDGSRLPAEVSPSPLEAEGEVLITSALRDISERNQVERTIRDLNADLERRVVERTAELMRSNEELQQFVYAASHDLQEPLRMISNYTQLIAERYRGRLDSDADEFIGFAVDGARRMHQLIDDLLTYSRLDTHGRPMIEVDCEEVLEFALTNLRVLIMESGARVTHKQLPKVMADGRQLVQLLQNLIGNAIKFHRAGIAPEVGVEAEYAGREWLFSVRDNGIGIDPRHAERIFVIFQRLHSRADYPGTGIGLALCKKIVLRHGGRIWVDSTPGGASTFRFTLPVCQEGK